MRLRPVQAIENKSRRRQERGKKLHTCFLKDQADKTSSSVLLYVHEPHGEAGSCQSVSLDGH